MAIYKIYPEKDATLYTEYPSKNTGLDSILEASTYLKETVGQTSRYLIKFSQTEINNVFDTYISNSTTEVTRTYNIGLRNYAAVVSGLNKDSRIDIYPTSGSWEMGTGRFDNDPETTNGCSWVFTDSSGSVKWKQSSWATYVTASFLDTLKGGGTWFTGSSTGLIISSSQTFNYSDPIDLNVDVTNICNLWISQSKGITGGDITNEGFLVKQGFSTSSQEFAPSESNSTTFRFFSIDTNTIYPPQLEIKFRDYTFNTGSSSNTILDNAESFISVYNNAETYFSQSVQRFRIAATPKYPTRTFATSSVYTTNYFLPTASYYAIKDSETNDYVIDFDNNYTQISADDNSSYFDIYMNGLEPERYYTILIKTELDSTTKVFDEDIIFKVING
jgi:hypothetical protein